MPEETTLRQRQALQVRATVLESVISQLEHNAADDVSMADVAKSAGISLRTLYRYFPDRPSLLRAAGEHLYGSLGVPIDIASPEDISKSLLNAARRLSSRPELTRALVQSTAGRATRSGVRGQRVDAITAALKPLTDGLDADTSRRATAVIAHLCSAASWVIIAEESGLDDADAQQAVAWAIDALVSTLKHAEPGIVSPTGPLITNPYKTARGAMMTTTPVTTERQMSSEGATSQAWWFLGTLAVLRNPQGAPRTPAVIELTVPPGGSPPRHVHEALDDSFLVLDGEVVVRCGEQTILGRPGTYVALPAGVEHTFRVTSPIPARLLLVHADDSFLGLIEAAGTPASELRLPPPGEFDVDLDTLVRLNAEHDSRIVGPSLEEDEARAFVTANADPAVLGPVNHVAVAVTDLRRSQQWYTQTFGLVCVDGDIAEDGTGHVTLLSPTGGWLLALTSAADPGVEHVAITCRDRQMLLEWADLLAEREAAPGSITDAPYGSGFVLRDPDGIEIELFSPALASP